MQRIGTADPAQIVRKQVIGGNLPQSSSSIFLRDSSEPEWVAFAQSRPEATIFHLPIWSRLIADAYGYRPVVMVQTDAAGRIMAGVPAMDVRTRLTGRRFAALPFTDYCPPLVRDAADLETFTAGLAQWWETAGRPRIEVRGPLPRRNGVRPVDVGVRHTLQLELDSERILHRSRRDTRASIQRARRDGVEVRVSRSVADLDTFYQLHVKTRQRLGVPVQPRRFIQALWEGVIEAGLGFAVFAFAGQQPIAAAIFLAWNGQLIYKYSASDVAYWKLRPNKLVVWTAIEWGCREGYQLFDFGRTDFEDSGLRDFKSSWGSTEMPLTYSYLRGQPLNTGRGAASRILARVIRSSPPIVCRAIGELLYRHFA